MASASDKGETGEKVNVLDPAAAPMATDAEVAGTPTSGTAAKQDLRYRLKEAWSHARPDTFEAWRQPGNEHQNRLGRLLLVWLVVLVGIGIAAGWYGLA